MSLQVIRREVALMLSLVNLRITEAEHKVIAGSDRERVDAAGELSFLKRQRDELQERLAEIDDHWNAPETVGQWLKEEVFNLNLRLKSWIAHG